MKVLAVSGKLLGGGAEHVTSLWLEGLRARGHDVRVITYVDDGLPPALLGMPREHLRLVSKAQRWTRLPLAIARSIARHDPDVVLGVLDFANLAVLVGAAAPRARRRGRPALVLSEHTVMTLFLRGQGRGGAARSQLARVLYRRADAAIAVSHAVATDLVIRCKLPSRHVYVLPNPLTLGAPQTARPEARDGGPTHHLVYAGRLVRAKRPDLVLRTAAELRGRGHPADVTFIGDGPERADLEALGAGLGVPVTVTGWIADWRSAAAGGDCLVLPSDVEGFGIVLIEAAAYGLPCVAPSSALGVADAIVPGVTGALALSAAPGDLADAVLAAVELVCVRQDAQRWLRHFDVDVAVDRLEAVLEQASARLR